MDDLSLNQRLPYLDLAEEEPDVRVRELLLLFLCTKSSTLWTGSSLNASQNQHPFPKKGGECLGLHNPNLG